MTADEIRTIVLNELTGIAPDIDESTLDANADLREDYDLDSMDSLTLITALHKRFGVNIPDTDYDQLASVNGIVAYLGRKLGV